MLTTPSPSGPERVEPAHDILRQALPRPLDCIFSPKAVALIGATESPNSVGRTVLENLQQGEFPGAIFPVNPKRDTCPGREGLPRHPRRAGEGGPGRHRHAPAVRSRNHPRLRAGGRARRRHHFSRLQGNRRGGAGAGAPSHGGGAARPDAHRGAELPGRDGARLEAQCHFCRGHGPGGERRIHQPERRALHGGPGLEPARECRLQRLCFAWVR